MLRHAPPYVTSNVITSVIKFVFLSAVTLTIFAAPFVTANDGQTVDQCTSTVTLNATTAYCPPGHLLTDERGYGGAHAQCRVLCRSANGAAGATTVASQCQTNTCSTHKLPDVCVPHATCAAACGRPGPKCVYSGSCASLHCFTSVPKRITFAGPGTVLAPAPHYPPGIPAFVYSQKDSCSMPLVATNPSIDYKVTPVIDGRRPGRHAQCRVLHGGFKSHDVEVISMPTWCQLCQSSDADQYWSNAPERTDVDPNLNVSFSESRSFVPRHLCIPHDTCELSCGKLPDGCVYSGSCAHAFCFSGSYSKESGKVVDPNSAAIAIEVDNSEPSPSGKRDPPAMAFFSNSTTATTTTPPLSSPPVSSSPDEGDSSPADSSPSSPGGSTNTDSAATSEAEPVVCIGAHHLSTTHKLVFSEHKRASVLCDESNNCATPWHIVIYNQRTLTMHAYCELDDVSCTRRVMLVNSPAYSVGLRIPTVSSHHGRNTNDDLSLHFTVFSASHGTRFEVMVMRLLVSLGF